MTRRLALGTLACTLIGMTAAATASATTLRQAAPHIRVGPNRSAPRLGGALGAGDDATDASTNWSGYFVEGPRKFKTVTTTFVQPKVTCTVAGAIAAFWVGLDGANDETVEQDGTIAFCNGKKPEYAAWWEMFPTNSVQPTFEVSPGDTIRSSVSFANMQYTLTVTDETNKTSRTDVERCQHGLKCLRKSAEWIVERPSLGAELAKLADFETMSVASDEASTKKTAQPISAFANAGIDMVNEADTSLLATVGPLEAGGTAFLDQWDAAS